MIVKEILCKAKKCFTNKILYYRNYPGVLFLFLPDRINFFIGKFSKPKIQQYSMLIHSSTNAGE